MLEQDLEKDLTEMISLRNFEGGPGGQAVVVSQRERKEVDERLVVFHRPRSIESEYFRFLKHRIEHQLEGSSGSGGKAILVTGPNLGVGKTTCSLNLALVFARSYGSKALLVDADSRRGATARYMGIKGELPGLVDVLTLKEKANRVLVNSGLFDMTYFPSGQFHDGFLDVMKGKELGYLIEDLKERFTYVVVDAPPAFPMPETAVLAQQCDGVFIVLRAGRDGVEDLEQAKEALEGVNILGVILNGVKPSPGHRYGKSGYYRYYGYYGKNAGNGE